jgi:hypothetical protein
MKRPRLEKRALPAAVAAWLVFGSALPAVATAEPADQVSITVRLYRTQPDGATSVASSRNLVQAAGQTRSLAVVVAYAPSAFMMLEDASFGAADGAAGEVIPDWFAPGGKRSGSVWALANTWFVQQRVVSIGVDAVTLELSWRRFERGTGGLHRTAGGVRTITLRSRERHLLDLADGRSARLANLALEVEASRVEDPAFADAVLAYDLWLVHDTAIGGRIARRLSLTGRQAEAVPFAFDRLAFPIDSAVPIDGDKGPVKTFIQGTVMGRLQADGSVEVMLRSERQVLGGGLVETLRRPALPELDPRLGSGSKAFVLKTGETTAIDFPTPSGIASWKAPDPVPARLRPGVSAGADGLLRLVRTEFFAGSKTSILITVRRVR